MAPYFVQTLPKLHCRGMCRWTVTADVQSVEYVRVKYMQGISLYKALISVKAGGSVQKQKTVLAEASRWRPTTEVQLDNRHQCTFTGC